MSRFHKLSHTIWHCQYHIVWVPKYRHRILDGAIQAATESGIQAISGYAGCEVVELNVQPDHVHLVAMVPPKLAISDLMGRVKGQTAIKLFKQFRHLRQKPYWGNHLWAKGYCVDTLGLDAEMIQKYVRHQEVKEKQIEQLTLGL
ncbi:MAG TPA: IS200/IS605 family transposase [Desulfobacterales bacterium]|nr:IS200/IS605 family transposase [Desulfobacterales bacterium]